MIVSSFLVTTTAVCCSENTHNWHNQPQAQIIWLHCYRDVVANVGTELGEWVHCGAWAMVSLPPS